MNLSINLGLVSGGGAGSVTPVPNNALTTNEGTVLTTNDGETITFVD